MSLTILPDFHPAEHCHSCFGTGVVEVLYSTRNGAQVEDCECPECDGDGLSPDARILAMIQAGLGEFGGDEGLLEELEDYSYSQRLNRIQWLQAFEEAQRQWGR